MDSRLSNKSTKVLMPKSSKYNLLLQLLLLPFLATPLAAQIWSRSLAEANRQKILLICNGTEPQSLDPSLANGIPEKELLEALFEGLVLDDPHNNGSYLPGVAESWEHNADYSSWTFHLRKNARWSNGEPVTARDFVFAGQRVLTASLGATHSDRYINVKGAMEYVEGKLTDFDQVGIHAVDDYTLRYDLTGPTPYFLIRVTDQAFFPENAASILKFGTMGQRNTPWTKPGNLVGNGPFMLTEWRENDVVVVRKNPNYWDAATVKLNEIRFFSIEDYSTMDRAFWAGQLHVTLTVPLDKVPRYRREHPDTFQIAPYLGVYSYMLNVKQKPLDDVRVRQALSLAIDRDAIVKNILRGKQQPATGYVPPGIPGYTPTNMVSYQPDKARQLLAEAGYPHGAGFPKINIFINTSEAHRTIAEAIQQMWKSELGIQVGITNQEWKVYLDTITKHNFDIARLGWIGDLDPIGFLDTFRTGSPDNISNWSNPQFDGLMHQSDQTGDPIARDKILAQAEQVLLGDACAIPIYWYTSTHLVHPTVIGWEPNLLDTHPWKFIDLAPVPPSGLAQSR